MLTGKHLSGPSKSHCNLISNQVYVIPGAEIPEFYEISRRINLHACSALNQRLDNDPADFMVVLKHHLLHIGKAFDITALSGLAKTAAIAVRPCGLQGVHQKRSVYAAVQINVPDRKGADGFPMVGIRYSSKPGLVCAAFLLVILETHLQRNFDSRRAVVCKKNLVQPFRRYPDNPFCQLDRRLVGKIGEDDMLKGIHLFLDSPVDSWVAVPEKVDPPGRNGIQVGSAIGIVKPGTFSPFDNDGRKILIVFHLGAGVPDMLQIFLLPDVHVRDSPLCKITGFKRIL